MIVGSENPWITLKSRDCVVTVDLVDRKSWIETHFTGLQCFRAMDMPGSRDQSTLDCLESITV